MLPQNRWMTYYKYRWLIRVVVALLVGALLVYVFKGCSMVPTEQSSTLSQKQRESVIGKATTDVVRATDTLPPNVTITTKAKDGTVVQIEQPTRQHSETTASTSAGESSDSSASGSSEWSIKVPMFVKVIGLAVGIGLFIGIIWFLRRNSAAIKKITDVADERVAEAVSMADDAFSDMIHSVRSEAITTTEPAQVAKLTTIAADIERKRSNFHKT